MYNEVKIAGKKIKINTYLIAKFPIPWGKSRII